MALNHRASCTNDYIFTVIVNFNTERTHVAQNAHNFVIGGWCNRKTNINIKYDCSNSDQIVQVGARNTNKPKSRVILLL